MPLMRMPTDVDTLTANLGKGLGLLESRRPDYITGRAYYTGNVKEQHGINANRAVAAILAKSGETHKLTFAAIPVDALIDKCNLNAIAIADKSASDAFGQVWEDSDLDAERDDVHTKTAYFGDYYMIVDPQEEDESGVIVSALVVGASPLTTVMVYGVRDGRTALYGVRAWDCDDHWEALLYYDDATVALATPAGTKGEAGTDPTKYEPMLEDDDNGNPIPGSHIVAHPGGRKLLEHFRVDERPYGRPVHRKAYGPQDAINKIHATELAAIDYLGFPQRYALLDPTASVDDDDAGDDFGTDGLPVDAEHPITGAGADGRLTPTSARTKLTSTPGSAWLLNGVKGVGQFDSAQIDNFLSPLDWEVRAMGVITGTPLFEFDLKGEQPSGEARRRASGRINKHAAKIQHSLGQSWENLAQTVLAVLGYNVDSKTITAAWAPTDVELDAEGLALVSAKVKAGVPVNKALVEAGYEQADVDKWWPLDGQHLAPDLWIPFGDLMRFVTQAQAGEVIMPKEVANLVPNYLTQPRDAGFAAPPPVKMAVPDGAMRQTPAQQDNAATDQASDNAILASV